MQVLYWYWVHAKNSRHLTGAIGYDSRWQAWWRNLLVLPSCRYDAPGGKVGWRFVRTMAADLDRVRECRWNAKRFVILHTVILQHDCHVLGSQAIWGRLLFCMDAWEDSQHHMMVEDTLHLCENLLLAVRWYEL